MALKLTFEHPHFPEGKEFSIGNIGIVPNGGSIDITDEQESQFVAEYGRTVQDAFANNPMVTISGTPTAVAPVPVVSPVEVVEEVTPPVPSDEGGEDN